MTTNIVKLIDEYIEQSDWRIRENSNMSWSYPGMLGYVVGHDTAEYMLQKVFPKQSAEAHREADIHIHDLSGMCNYCLGLDFEMFLMQGLDDIDGAPKHFSSALSMLHNTIFLISQQIAGAIAFNSVDILLAPYIKNDGITYKQMKQTLQEFVYTINIKGRIGFQSPFLNFQLDMTVPKRLKGRNPIIGTNTMDFTYDDCKQEIEWFNRALFEIMMEAKRPLAFPVINVGITKDFPWESKTAETIFTAIGKTGQPTINNYVSGNYDPDAVKSMCCSLRLDMEAIMKQTGGQFGAADNSGSLGVVTLNLPRYGYLSKGNRDKLYEFIDKNMSIAFEALVEKRRFVEKMMGIGMYPTVKRFIYDFSHFFNTIGVIGLNEMCLNMGMNGIEDNESKEFCKDVLRHINQKIVEFQVEHKDFYGKNKGLIANLELIPGEGVMHRFARHDKKKYPDIITANGTGGDYYTRGSWLPTDKEYNVFFAAKHQEDIQDLFSGGANYNYYLNEPVYDWKAIKSLVKKLVNNTTLPFISISPSINVCQICGKKETNEDYCVHELSEYQIKELQEKGIEIHPF